MTRIAVLIPCFNEAPTVGKVIHDFRAALPEASIHVFDNCSTDRTAQIASEAGATVHFVRRQGKGNVVRTMFREIDADVGIMVDGDDTYPADRARDLITPVLFRQTDMVIGTRLVEHGEKSFRPLHIFGNRFVLETCNLLFGAKLTDVLSGYRAFSRRFMKTMPVLSAGFEIETEMTVHALVHQMPIAEVPVVYGERPAGSRSKLNTLRDGYRVLKTVFWLFKDHRPLLFFGSIGVLAMLAGVVMGIAVFREFLDYQRVVGAARAVLAVSAVVVGMVSLTTGLVLDTVNRRSRELYVLLADSMARPSPKRSVRVRSRADAEAPTVAAGEVRDMGVPSNVKAGP